MKLFKQVLIAVFILTASVYFGAAFLPAEMKVVRYIELQVPAERVFEQISNLQNWNRWSPWTTNDPGIQITYGAEVTGIGASYSWSGKGSGKGKMQIVDWKKNQLVQSEVEFADHGKSIFTWTLEPGTHRDSVKVTWQVSTHARFPNLHLRYLGLMMEPIFGPWLEQGLQNLAKHLKA